VTFSGVNIFRFGDDGKVVEIWNHRDDLGLREQLGAPVFAGARPRPRTRGGHASTRPLRTHACAVSHLDCRGTKRAGAPSSLRGTRFGVTPPGCRFAWRKRA
jgi:hypothetical protein